ncbi:MAG: DUF998 domain-containing protein [Kibdelosporangium sp.]
MAVTPPRWTRAGAQLGLTGVAASILLIGLLHVIPPSSQVSAVRRTISEYALLADGWVFDLGVTALAVGSLAVLVSLIGHRAVKAGSFPSLLIVLWSACLLAIVAFPKNNWAAGGAGMGGMIHRYASVTAFVSLPLAAILIGRATRSAWPVWLGAISLAWFAFILGAVLLQPFTGVRWWVAIPLGAVERGLLFTEVAAVASLAFVRRSSRSAATPDPAAMSSATG